MVEKTVLQSLCFNAPTNIDTANHLILSRRHLKSMGGNRIRAQDKRVKTDLTFFLVAVPGLVPDVHEEAEVVGFEAVVLLALQDVDVVAVRHGRAGDVGTVGHQVFSCWMELKIKIQGLSLSTFLIEKDVF